MTAIHSIRLHRMACEDSVCWSSITVLSPRSMRLTVTGSGGRWSIDSSMARSSLFSSMICCGDSERMVLGWGGL